MSTGITSKKTSKAAGKKAGTSKQGTQSLRVRMYRVGFGDFFLVTVPTRTSDRYINRLRVHSGRTGKGDIGSLVEAVEDVYQTTKGELALVTDASSRRSHRRLWTSCAVQRLQGQHGLDALLGEAQRLKGLKESRS